MTLFSLAWACGSLSSRAWPFAWLRAFDAQVDPPDRFAGALPRRLSRFQLEDGLSTNWHHTYDPTLGRYTQADPLGFVDGPGIYNYVGGSPVMGVDPSGRNPALIGFSLRLGGKLLGERLGSGLLGAGTGGLIGCYLFGYCGDPMAPYYPPSVPDNVCVMPLDGAGPLPPLMADPGPSLPEGLIGNKPLQGKTGSGTKVYGGSGGTGERDGDFDGIPGEAVNKGNGVKVKTLPDGTKVISRPGDSRPGENGGTIEVQSPGGKSWIKIRY